MAKHKAKEGAKTERKANLPGRTRKLKVGQYVKLDKAIQSDETNSKK